MKERATAGGGGESAAAAAAAASAGGGGGGGESAAAAAAAAASVARDPTPAEVTAADIASFVTPRETAPGSRIFVDVPDYPKGYIQERLVVPRDAAQDRLMAAMKVQEAANASYDAATAALDAVRRARRIFPPYRSTYAHRVQPQTS